MDDTYGSPVFKEKTDFSHNPIIISKIQSYSLIDVSRIKDYAKEKAFLESSLSYDCNDYVSECYIDPEYLSNINKVRLRPYNLGIILGFFSSTKREFAVRSYNLTNIQNGEVMPLITDITLSDVPVGTLVGYIVFKDIENLTLLPSEAGEGQELNISLCSKLFSQITIWNHLLPQRQFNLGTESVSLDNLQNNATSYKGMYIALPDDIYAVTGDKIQIYFKSILHCVNYNDVDVIAICQKGKSYPRYWEYTPVSSDEGTTASLIVRVRGNDLSVLCEKTITINFIPKMTSPASVKNVLCVGASATANGVWAGELRRRLVENSGDGTPANPMGLGLHNITFVGRKTGTSVNVPLEATGGWRVQEYASSGELAIRFYVTGVNTLSMGSTYSLNGVIYILQEVNVTEGVGNIRCTLQSTFVTPPPTGTLEKLSGEGDASITYASFSEESFSPFWNTGTGSLDFQGYANNFCDGHIDYLIFYCGVNDIFSGSMVAVNNAINAFRNLLRAYHSDFPNGIVIISSVPVGSINGGFGANYGASATSNSFTFANIARLYSIALYNLCKETEFSSYVRYAAVLEEFDCENNYPYALTPVNTRSSETEKLGTNGVHPITAGSLQVADGIYRTFNM